jgi:hypothetical protein
MKKDRYLVVGYKTTESKADPEEFELGAAIRESTVVCDTFAKAYELAIFLGGITDPGKAYRGALEEIKLKYSTEILQKGNLSAGIGETLPRAMIFKIKSY